MGICGSKTLKITPDPILKVNQAQVPSDHLELGECKLKKQSLKSTKDQKKKSGSPSNIQKTRRKRSSSSIKKSSTIVAYTDGLLRRSASVKEQERITGGLFFKKGHVLYQGSQGEVFQCFDVNTGQLYALKTIRKHKKRESLESEVLSLQREIAKYQKLSHHNIVKYIATELDEDGQGINIIFEFVPGGSVTQMLNKFGKFNEKLVAKFTYQVLQGLSYLHDHNILHRDIKGGNILIDTDGTLKLTDFGILKLHKKDAYQGLESEEQANSKQPLDSSKSQTTSQQLGYVDNLKPFWTAPEVLENEDLNKTLSDIWSLGCLVIEMLTAQPPYVELIDLTYEQITQHIQQGNLPIFPDHLSLDCRQFLESTLQFNPENRSNVETLLQLPFITERDTINATAESFSPYQQRSGELKSSTSLGFVGGLGVGESQHYQPQQTSPSQVDIFGESSNKMNERNNSNRIKIRMVEKQDKNNNKTLKNEHSSQAIGRIHRREKNKFDMEIGKLFKDTYQQEAKNEYQQQLITQFKELEGRLSTENNINGQTSTRSLSLMQSQVQQSNQIIKLISSEEDEDQQKQGQKDVEDEILNMIKKKKINKQPLPAGRVEERQISDVKQEEQYFNEQDVDHNRGRMNSQEGRIKSDGYQRQIQVVFDNPKDLFQLIPPAQTIIFNYSNLQNQFNDIQIKEENDDDELSQDEDTEGKSEENYQHFSNAQNRQYPSEDEIQTPKQLQKEEINQINKSLQVKGDQNSPETPMKEKLNQDVKKCNSLSSSNSPSMSSPKMIMITDPMVAVLGQLEDSYDNHMNSQLQNLDFFYFFQPPFNHQSNNQISLLKKNQQIYETKLSQSP